MQHGGVGNSTLRGPGQFQLVSSRSSVGEYYMFGAPEEFKLGAAIIEGEIIKKPFAFLDREIHVITNQTFVMASSSVQQPLKIAAANKPIHTWKYQVNSPNSPPSNPADKKIWVNYQGKVSSLLCQVYIKLITDSYSLNRCIFPVL